MLDRAEKPKIAREQQMISQFTRRTGGDLQIALKFVVATLAAALCKISRYRSAATPRLTCQTMSSSLGNPRVHFIKIQSEPVRSSSKPSNL